mgnify:FL=1
MCFLAVQLAQVISQSMKMLIAISEQSQYDIKEQNFRFFRDLFKQHQITLKDINHKDEIKWGYKTCRSCALNKYVSITPICRIPGNSVVIIFKIDTKGTELFPTKTHSYEITAHAAKRGA